MQQYFIKGQVENPVIIKDKDTVKHMFNVMRLTEDDQVVLVFEDGIKRLARVTDRENHVFEVIEDLTDNVEMPVSVTIASGFPKGDKLELVTQKATELGAQAIWAFPADWSVVKWDGKKLAKKKKDSKDQNTVDMFTGLSIKQCLMFGDKLSRDIAFQNHYKANVGENIEDYAERIATMLSDAFYVTEWMPYLETVGYINHKKE